MVNSIHIQNIADRIAREFNPEKIILFGSHAYGYPEPDSDIDLLVIMPFEGKNFYQSLKILNRVNPKVAMDILARKPEDTKKRYEMGDPLIREAIDKGKVLYERNCSRMDL